MKVVNGYISLYYVDELIDCCFYHSVKTRQSIICKWRNKYGQLNRFHFIVTHIEITPSKEEQALMYCLDNLETINA